MVLAAVSFTLPGGGGSLAEGEQGGVIVNKHKPIDRFRKKAAHRMRATATDGEARLWKYLRKHPMSGSHFRRQVVIGPYIADFACMAAKLIIEVDGSQHGEPANVARDQARTNWLQSEGFRVLRFWNNDLFGNIDGVLSEIHAALRVVAAADAVHLKHERRRKSDHPTPARVARRPSPSRGG